MSVRRLSTRSLRSPEFGGSKSGEHVHSNRFYDDRAQAYAERTLDAPKPPLLDVFITRLAPGARVLDLGCGAGRDLLTLRHAGFKCIGVDLSRQLASIARAHAGAPTLAADMRTLAYGKAEFDGVVAIASLLHLSSDEQASQVSKIFDWLRPGGLFLASMKIGIGLEIADDARGFVYVAPAAWLDMLRARGFETLLHEVSPSSDSVSSTTHDWLAVLARKPGSA